MFLISILLVEHFSGSLAVMILGLLEMSFAPLIVCGVITSCLTPR